MTINLCTVEHGLQLISAVLAALAALTWLWASRMKAPKFTEEEAQALYDAPIPILVTLVRVIARQSRMNALAAVFAALAALCQIPLAFMPTCWS
jgi:hypothetical protein